MPFHPQFRELGKLELIEVYEFFDKPLLVACRNAADHIFMAVLVGEDETRETWLYVALSPLRFEHVKSSAMDLRDTFAQAEDGVVFEVNIYHEDEKAADFKIIPSESIAEERLPLVGERLSIKTQTLPQLESNLLRKSSQTKRQFVRLRVSLPDVLRTEAPASLLGEVLTSFQELISLTVHSIRETAKAKGHVSPEMLVLAFGHGSFEVELASSDMVDLFDDSDTGRAIEEVVNLINIGGDSDRLKERLSYLKIRVALKYRSFLKSFSDRVSDAHIEWASPKEGQSRNAHISAITAKAAIKIIEQTEFQTPDEYIVIGKLVGANLRSKTFEIWSTSEKGRRKKYSGRILDQAMETVRGATLDRDYAATIRQTVGINIMTGEPTDKYELVRLQSS